jgi:transposase InsO family protein
LSESVVEQILLLRRELTAGGHDAGPETIRWHLVHHHSIRVSRASISRYLSRAGLVVPQPKKRPRSSYIRFEAELPNECWQSDFTHYRLAGTRGRPGADAEILSWLDDHSRKALLVTVHERVTGRAVLGCFRECVAIHGIPASTLTDNGMVFTARFSGGKGGRNGFESELVRLGVTQKNSRPNHPTTCGKVERFQLTMKKWLRVQPVQPTTIDELQALLDVFVDEYNCERPHRSLAANSTPEMTYVARPKADPGPLQADPHNRVRRDRVDDSGSVTLRLHGKLHHIGIGRAHARTHVLLLIQDLHVRVVAAGTGELIRKLEVDPSRDYQPTGAPRGPTRPGVGPN